MKRLLDFAASLIGLILLLPFFALVAALIALESKGPVFFRQERVGKYGKPFVMWKFRTMVLDAVAQGSAITGPGDSRITRVGHYLRLTKIDELPNLINVLGGDMSLVGPRPELPQFFEGLSDEEKQILTVHPGITGPTQLRYISEEEMLAPVNVDENYAESVLRDKLKSDIRYVRERTFFRDLGLIFATFFAIAFKLLGRRTGVMHDSDLREAYEDKPQRD
ncbi:MAG: sugar transferase [bacterium]|nr:sugar transferase [bacterium]